MQLSKTRQLTLAAAIGAAYVVLTLGASVFGIAYGPIQCRFSEALCVLPFFFPQATWGLFVGCVLANLMSLYGPVDVVCGSLATLLACLCTARIKNKYFAPLPPVLFNAAIIGAMISYFEVGFAEGFAPAFAFNALTVGLGELIACYALGLPLLHLLPRIPFFRERIVQNLPERRIK